MRQSRKFFALIAFSLFFIASPAAGQYRRVVADIESTLRAAPRLGAYDVRVDYHRGHITLKGEVASRQDEQRVVRLVEGVDGVKSVRSSLLVNTAAAGGEDIIAAIQEALTQEADLVGSVIELEGRGGVVILRGEVATSEARRRVLAVARAAAPQLTIESALTVRDSDKEIRSGLQKALQGFSGVTTQVEDGKVTLAGSLSSQREIDRLLSRVLMVEGVEDINSKLTINGRPYGQ